MNESALVSRLIQNDKDAFTQLYHLYWKRVYNFTRLYLSNRDVAEEVVQEVFIKLWEKRNTISSDHSIDGLLFIMTRNCIFNLHRNSLNKDACYSNVALSMDLYDQSDVEYEINDLNRCIHELIDQLPSRRREIFKLSRFEYKTYKEIANQLTISEKTVENQISEALRFLKSKIKYLMILVVYLYVKFM